MGNTLETPVASRNGCSIRKSGVSVSQCAGSSGLLTIQKRDKNPALNREVLCAKMRARNETNCRLRETKRCLRTRQWLLHVADTREGGRAWRQARDEKVITREDGYTYIAALRSPDRRHTTKREGDTSVTVVTSNYSGKL